MSFRQADKETVDSSGHSGPCWTEWPAGETQTSSNAYLTVQLGRLEGIKRVL